MKSFGKRDHGATVAPAALVSAPIPERENAPPVSNVLLALRGRVIEQIDPSLAATVSRDVLRSQIQEIIHAIANREKLELSGREEARLSDDIADDMTGYGPLHPLL